MPVTIADKEISRSIQVLLSMLKPNSIIAMIITCGQRCQIHNLQGARSKKNSNEMALARTEKEISPENNNACLKEISN